MGNFQGHVETTSEVGPVECWSLLSFHEARRVPPRCENHPADFLATFKFRPTGGSLYKSVGFTFDTTEARESLVYLSAHAPGPKLQIAYGKANQYAYPTAGAQARAVKLGDALNFQRRAAGALDLRAHLVQEMREVFDLEGIPLRFLLRKSKNPYGEKED